MGKAAPSGGNPRPLVSSVTEIRLLSIGFLIDGLVLGVAALVVMPPGRALAMIVLFGVFWGAFMYLFFILVIRRAVEKASAPRTPQRESADATLRRVVRSTVGLLAVLAALSIVQGDPEIASGGCLGGSGLLLAVSRWLRHWEEKHSACLLREPRWKRRKGQGFYVEDRPLGEAG